MKRIFTLLILIATLLFNHSVIAQCNITSGGNGISKDLSTPIVIDGDMQDWDSYLSDPDNITFDNTNGVDMDASVSDVGRDITQFGFTVDASNFYLFLKRSGSTSNTVDMLMYLDINDNDYMDLLEPVIHVAWSGANRSVNVSIQNYIPASTAIYNSISSNMDGSMLKGSLVHRLFYGQSGRGSLDGTSMEAMIPLSYLSQLNAFGVAINQLKHGDPFKFHVSTINGSIASIPNLNSVNDNFGGCMKMPIVNSTLPVVISMFNANYLQNDQVALTWTASSEINLSHYIIERSTDGTNFSTVAVVMGQNIQSGSASYSFDDKQPGTSGTIYYRLQMVDIDGSYEYSTVKIVRVGNQKVQQTIQVNAWPNPVHSNLTISMPEHWRQKQVRIEIYNAAGQMLSRKEVTNAGVQEAMDMSGFKTGMMIMKLVCGNETGVQKIFKN